nr:Fic family protein [Synergistes sp.]
VLEAAKRWGLSERSVRNYCAQGRIPGALLTGKTWNIPETAEKPARKTRRDAGKRDLLTVLREEKAAKLPGGIYHKVQIDLTFNSNHIEGSRLTHDQTRMIFETNTIGMDAAVRVDDVVETANHFRCIDLIIDAANHAPSESLIKQLHAVLKNGTSDSRKDWFVVGDYKRFPNEVGGNATTAPEAVPAAMKTLLRDYNAKKEKSFDDLLDFHYRFERIHPFQDGNGRIGRLLLFKECLRSGIIPFIITDDLKLYYYRGLQNWETEPGYFRDTCGLAQDRFRQVLEYFKIIYPTAESRLDLK